MKPLFLFIGLIFCQLPTLAIAQTLDDRLWDTDGTVYAIAQKGNTLYVGGEFSYVGPKNGSGVAVSSVTGKVLPNFSNVGNNIEALYDVRVAISDLKGGWFIGGDFTQIDGLPFLRLAHIKSNGSVDLDWVANTSGTVTALALSGDTLYVGGGFDKVGGVTRNNIAALNAISGSVLPWNPSADRSVYALQVQENVLFVAGSFSTFGGQPRDLLASVNLIDGSVTNWAPGTRYFPNDEYVGSLLVRGDTVFIGGYFFNLQNAGHGYLAAISATTGSVLPWHVYLDGVVWAMDEYDGILYIGGAISQVGGLPRYRIAAVDRMTGIPTSWNPYSNSSVYSIKAHDGILYVGGAFTTIGGKIRNKLAALSSTTAEATAWDPGASDLAFSFAIQGDTIYIGGRFSSVGGVRRNNAAAFDLTTGSVTPWDPNPRDPHGGGIVRALAITHDHIYLGGAYTTIRGITRLSLAKVDLLVGEVTDWDPNIYYGVNALLLKDNLLYVAGSFEYINLVPHNRLAAFDVTTGLLTPFRPDPDGFVNSLVIKDNLMYVGGFFSNIRGVPRKNLASVDRMTGTVTSWKPDPNQEVLALAFSGSTLYAGGWFDSFENAPRAYIAAINTNNNSLLNWNPAIEGASSVVRSLAVSQDAIYVGGFFNRIANTDSKIIASIDQTSAQSLNWNASASSGIFNTGVYCIHPNVDRIFIGGKFTSVLGKKRRSLASISANVTTGTLAEVLNKNDIMITPNPVDDFLSLKFNMTSSFTCKLQFINLHGIIMLQTMIDKYPAGETAFKIPLTALSTGLYLLRIVDTSTGLCIRSEKIFKY